MENIAIFENKIKVNIYGPNLEIENDVEKIKRSKTKQYGAKTKLSERTGKNH